MSNVLDPRIDCLRPLQEEDEDEEKPKIGTIERDLWVF